MKLNLAQHIKSLPAHLAIKIHAKALNRVTLSAHLRIAKYIFALLASFACLSNTYARVESAGVVTMTIGKAYLNGNTLITTGTKLNSGDDIETMSNGHVHIRFIDNGLVSVRPNSNLFIEQYLYNADSPEESIIKFNLKEGVMRSISGKGAKSARDKFRLNTPIAAIGVRGTDFVVKASQDLIQAAVNEGAIIVAPFSDACSVEALGPCATNSVELTGDTKQLLELSSLTSIPRLVPLSETFANDLSENIAPKGKKAVSPKKESSSKESDTSAQEQPQGAALTSLDQSNLASTNEDKENTLEPLVDQSYIEQTSSLGSSPTTTILASDSSSGTTFSSESINTAGESDVTTSFSLAGDDIDNEVTLVIFASAASTTVDNVDSPFIRIKPDDYVPSEPLTAEAQSKRALSWGRWSNATLDTDRLVTTAYNAKNSRKVAIADLTYALYREDSGLNTIDRTLGNVAFNLVDAQATLTTAGGESSLMAVKDGLLKVNFANGSFATSILANHELTSDVVISGTGNISSQGFLSGGSANTSIKGATTLDGTEASYLFNKDIDLGTIEGVTYWNR